MNEYSGLKLGLKVIKNPKEMWSISIGLSHFVDETYLHINFFRWSISIGYLYKDWI